MNDTALERLCIERLGLLPEEVIDWILGDLPEGGEKE